jgi:hypothetical protein
VLIRQPANEVATKMVGCPLMHKQCLRKHVVWPKGVAGAVEAYAECRDNLLGVVAVGTGLDYGSRCSGKQL